MLQGHAARLGRVLGARGRQSPPYVASPARCSTRRLRFASNGAQKLGNEGRAAAQGQQDAAAAQAAPPDSPHIECIGTGMEVECRLMTDGPEHVAVAKPEEEAQAVLEHEHRLQHAGPNGILDALLLVSPFFFWGTSMVAMKQLAPHTTPLFVAAWRLLPAGAALLVWAARSGRKAPTEPMAWLAVALFGLVDGAAFQGFLAEGLQRTSAGLGSVIIDSQPLTVALLAALLFGERLGAAGVAGLFIGVAGLCLLEVPPSLLDQLPQTLPAALAQLGSEGAALSQSLPAADSGGTAVAAAAAAAGDGAPSWSIWDSGEWWMLLAAQSMAVGTVMVRWVAKYCDPVVATGWHMVLGGIPLLALAAVQEGAEAQERLSQLTGFDAVLLLYVSLLGSAASYGVFFYNASRGNLTALSCLTFLTPMFAAAGGYLALGETLTPLQLAGAVVTLGAVGLINNNSGDTGSGSSEGDSEQAVHGSSSSSSETRKGQ